MPTTARNQPELQDRALDLRGRGYTYEQIRVATGISSVAAVRRAIWAAQARQTGVVPGERPTHVDALARRFGVEIEVVGITTSQAARALEAAGIACEDRGYTHSVLSVWKAVTDASVMGCEVVSPILQGAAGLSQLAQVMTALRNAGGIVDRSAGMHVHLDVADMTGDDIADLLDTYTRCQLAYDGLVSRSRRSETQRRNGGYCRPWGDAEKERAMEHLKSRRLTGGGDRYRTINLESLPRYGTVEVRQHQGTLNGQKATSWVRLLLATCAAVRVGARIDTVDPVELVNQLTAHGLGQNARNFLLGRAATLAA